MKRIIDFIIQIFQGRSIYRILFNWHVQKNCQQISGEILDLAGGSGSYVYYLPEEAQLIQTDLRDFKFNKRIDLNHPLDFADSSFSTVFLFNALYILDDPIASLKEIRRILKPGGQLFLTAPFISNIMADPHDYARHTDEGLRRIFKAAGFSSFSISPFGERFSSAAYLIHPFMMFNGIRLVVYGVALFLDSIIPSKIKIKYPTPLGYFVVLIKGA